MYPQLADWIMKYLVEVGVTAGVAPGGGCALLLRHGHAAVGPLLAQLAGVHEPGRQIAHISCLLKKRKNVDCRSMPPYYLFIFGQPCQAIKSGRKY